MKVSNLLKYRMIQIGDHRNSSLPHHKILLAKYIFFCFSFSLSGSASPIKKNAVKLEPAFSPKQQTQPIYAPKITN